jgi:hypothetical protein
MSTVGKFGNHAGWREIDGNRYYFHSRWEANYARFLEWLRRQKQIIEWLYEPETFYFHDPDSVEKKMATVSYKPDFKILELIGSHYWVEVKGYMDQRSKTKLKLFKRHFPQERLWFIDKKWFAENNPKLKGLVPEWES